MASKEKNTDSIYINREISWMSFNERVLSEAADTSVPLLERLKFLMIYQSNLEEFFQVRIGILTHRTILTPDKKDPVSGMLSSETIQEVLRITRQQQSLAESVWKAIRTELKNNGIEVLNFSKINKVDELMSKKLFGDVKKNLFPQIIKADQSLPFLWGGERYIIAFLGKETVEDIAVIPLHRVPAYLNFEINGVQKIVIMDHLVRRFLPLLLKGRNILGSAAVKVTRNADVFLDKMAFKEDLRKKTSSMLSKRKREAPVRLCIQGKLTENARQLLVRKLRIPEQNVFTTSLPFDLSFYSGISSNARFRYDERRPVRDIGLKKGEYFRYIEKHDLLLSFPFQSMMSIVDLIYEAADDPEVLSIRIMLYRMSERSKIAAALAYAADQGKDVLCLLELRARFDEQNNIDYSEMLEDAGCQIIYGLPDYKVHSKVLLITRQHEGNLSTITQVGTGNYNEITAEQYTDLSLITADPLVGKDAENAFQALLRQELPPEAHALWIAPYSFKTRVIEFLDAQIAKGSAGRVSIKCNAINNLDIMEKLIECSQAGVTVELYIRGICCLRPGIPGKTENITVKSVVGRWLEHSRIYSFGDGDDQRIFIGSGGLLNRNLERRVEAFIEVRTPDTRKQVNEIFRALRDDYEKARFMQPDGTYIRLKSEGKSSSQEALYQYFSGQRVSLEDPEEAAPDAEPKPQVQSPAEPVSDVVSAASEPTDTESIQEVDGEPSKKESLFGKIRKLFSR